MKTNIKKGDWVTIKIKDIHHVGKVVNIYGEMYLVELQDGNHISTHVGNLAKIDTSVRWSFLDTIAHIRDCWKKTNRQNRALALLFFLFCFACIGWGLMAATPALSFMFLTFGLFSGMFALDRFL